ncbi:hypothetical protein RF11_13348 [Thelohanellus kitauei]|uniref:Uncharacterized protein n=1 Tax=Thelohanellus kitauei TaxID=669202 RepID=A0A0C2MZQ3_THEKT|nr:hypothetical protein RF11_13348 [Thelohanellus kitauei]
MQGRGGYGSGLQLFENWFREMNVLAGLKRWTTAGLDVIHSGISLLYASEFYRIVQKLLEKQTGTFLDYNEEIQPNFETNTIFLKHRPLSFLSKTLMKKELQLMVNSGILMREACKDGTPFRT